MSYSCPRCGYCTDRVNNLRKHLSRKRSCLPSKADVDLRTFTFVTEHQQKKEFQCSYCETLFISEKALSRHEEVCTAKEVLFFINGTIRDLGNPIPEVTREECSRLDKLALLRLLQDVYRKGGQVPTPDRNHVVVTGNSNTTNVGCITVNFPVSFGTEELSLSLQELETLLKVHPITAVKNFVEKTHFSSEEGNNWYISNLKDGRAKVYDNGEWISKDADEVVYSVFDKHRNTIDETCELAKSEDGSLPANTLGERVKRWERETSNPLFEDTCQQKIFTLGYENKARVSRVKQRRSFSRETSNSK